MEATRIRRLPHWPQLEPLMSAAWKQNHVLFGHKSGTGKFGQSFESDYDTRLAQCGFCLARRQSQQCQCHCSFVCQEHPYSPSTTSWSSEARLCAVVELGAGRFCLEET